MTTILAASAPETAAVAALLREPQTRRMLIGGEWVDARSGGTIPVVDPATGNTIAHLQRGAETDIDVAVSAARDALAVWGKVNPRQKAAILHRIGELIDENVEELSELETLDQGKPYGVSRWAEIPSAAKQFRYFAGLVHTVQGRTINTSVEYQP